ncbi:GNAT family N-acetyltransferase [Thermoflavimicrobium dichotomicum]|uniref:Protein N-acetyltransferase, RimJ/RimL family n=1 Tax=Thermoflavimicrobium dichotomicum TaxID=46223 RepID=A0A1I3NX59_9BACL|nr:GNAT family N-acetyltransferase [Thermoflavimicrobium dichotomicum]SFJ13692.1 Protein N-acetyltransferase, RimJ/RimL family [Thermoflavimicrobium dichotomicum]
MPDIIWKTSRLQARKLTLLDVDHLLKIFTDPIAMAYYPSTKTREETIEWIKRNLQMYQNEGMGLWAIELKQSQTFIGQCGLVIQEVEGQKEIEIGYLFIRDFWGNGYATEAAHACKEYGFHVLQQQRFISLIDPRNEASKGVAKRIGMNKEKEIVKWGKNIEVYAVHLTRQ